jgi:hypothetical protein
VRAAVADGSLAAERLENYHKLRGELAYLDRRHDAAAQAEQKRRDKAMHKGLYRHSLKRNWYD